MVVAGPIAHTFGGAERGLLRLLCRGSPRRERERREREREREERGERGERERRERREREKREERGRRDFLPLTGYQIIIIKT